MARASCVPIVPQPSSPTFFFGIYDDKRYDVKVVIFTFCLPGAPASFGLEASSFRTA
jgi:hypothetical protein